MIFRILGPFGLAILFIMTSGDLRKTVLDAVGVGSVYLQNYSPYSYIGVGLVCLFLFLLSLKPKRYESSIL